MEESSLMNTAAGDHDHELMQLPPGFRFHPTDEEIITHYLTKKVINSSFTATAIGEVDLNKCEPWDLPKRAKMGEKEWYFFCQKDRKYPTGMRTNRATQSGYWKATGKDKEIFRGKNCLVGMKKTLVFYRGRAPKGEKTNWVMHEYRLEGKLPSFYTLHKVAKDGWAVCRIFHKSTGIKKPNSYGGEEELSGGSLPSLVDPSYSGGPSLSYVKDDDNEIRVSDGSFLYNSIGPSHSALNNIMSQVTGRYGQMNPDQSMLYPHPGQTIMNNSHPIVQGTPAQLFNQLGTMNNNVTQCKVEPNQSRSMVSGPSQDTGLSTDLNPEISSSLSKQGLASGTTPFEDLMNPFFGGSINSDELGFSWDYL